jgi:hypothetical protein
MRYRTWRCPMAHRIRPVTGPHVLPAALCPDPNPTSKAAPHQRTPRNFICQTLIITALHLLKARTPSRLSSRGISASLRRPKACLIFCHPLQNNFVIGARRTPNPPAAKRLARGNQGPSTAVTVLVPSAPNNSVEGRTSRGTKKAVILMRRRRRNGSVKLARESTIGRTIFTDIIGSLLRAGDKVGGYYRSCLSWSNTHLYSLLLV